MNLDKLTNSVKGIGTKIVEKASTLKPNKEVATSVVRGGKQKIKSSMDAMATIGKAGMSKIAEHKELKELAAKETHRVNALVEESISLGVNKDFAKKGAEALISVTGKFGYKSAEKSAATFISAGKTWAEKVTEIAARKTDLIQKFKK